MNNTKIDEYYYARIKNKNDNYVKIGREFENEILCINRLKEWLDENKRYDEEHNNFRYDYTSWEIIKESVQIKQTLLSSKIIYGNNNGWALITESEKEKILFDHSYRCESNLNEFIKDYKFLSESIWGLEYPLLDHFIMFKTEEGVEYLISHTYLQEDEIEKEMMNHPDLKYKIEDNIFYGFYRHRATNILLIYK